MGRVCPTQGRPWDVAAPIERAWEWQMPENSCRLGRCMAPRMHWARLIITLLAASTAAACGSDDAGRPGNASGGSGNSAGAGAAGGAASGGSSAGASGGNGGGGSSGSGGSSPYSCGDTKLAQVAASLSPGQSAQFTKNLLQNHNDIQWQVGTLFWDPNRRELQYMGKPASGQSLNHSHYIYSADTDTWSTTGQMLFPGIGHIWYPAFDAANGDYFYRQYNTNVIHWFDRSDGANGTWKESPEQLPPALNEGNANFAAMGWHPNLFGAGKPGLFIWAVFRFFGYDLTTHTFSVLSSDKFPSGSPYRNRKTGQAVYLPGPDQLLCFGQANEVGHPALLVKAGAGSSSDVFGDQLVTPTSAPPIEVYGGGADDNHGHVVNHPDDPNRLLLLDESGTSRVWQSDDFGATWVLQSYEHPFQEMHNWSSGEYTAGSVPCGVVVGMTSDGNGGETVLWKPGS